jgi:Pretoxin HINT domain
LLASGAAIAISQLKAGDKVLATNVKTGKTSPESVTAVLLHHDTDLYDLTVNTSQGTVVIQTTSSHLFWDQTAGRWVKAGALKYGDKLRAANGTIATAAGGTVPAGAADWMWDLSVPGGGDHDFYIDAAATAVLVHNCPIGDGPSSEETTHSTLRGGAGERNIESSEVMNNAENMYYDEDGNQVYRWSQPDGDSQIVIRNPANGNILTNQLSSDTWIERQIEIGRWYDLQGG